MRIGWFTDVPPDSTHAPPAPTFKSIKITHPLYDELRMNRLETTYVVYNCYKNG